MLVETLLRSLPDDKRAVLAEAVDALRAVRGMAAVALGGSYARGTQHPGSDIDLGLYYIEHDPFAIADIRRVAERIAVQPPVVTEFYEWGPWVNGGAWIPTRAGKVDFLYRNVNHVQRVIADAQQGRVELHFAQQPPFGFYSVIYLAETHVAVPLHDPEDLLGALKKTVVSYPSALKQTILREYLWGVEFTLLFARDFAARHEVYNVAGCLTRALSYLTQVLFALNETYFISDKGAIATVAAFPIAPPRYAERVEEVLAHPGSTTQELSRTVALLESLFRDAVKCAPDYQPKYVV